MVCYLTVAGFFSAKAADLTHAKFTQVVNEVNVVNSSTQQKSPGKIGDNFAIPDLLETGPMSRAELQAPDQTITRVGSNTIFSFSPESRTIDLKQGSLLFQSPHGKGGGTIKTAAATAGVLGTTIITLATSNGGFKFLVLEGVGKATLPNGRSLELGAGHLTFVLPGSKGFGPVIEFRLGEFVKNCGLIQNFRGQLPSINKIDNAVHHQEDKIRKGQSTATNYLVGDAKSDSDFQIYDANARQNFFDDNAQALLLNAFLTDAVINSSKLDPQRVFVLSLPVLVPTIDPNQPIPAASLAFFAGRNITITTPTIDLSPYAGSAAFGFLALNNINIDGSLTISGTPGGVGLLALNAINIAPGSTLTFNTGSSQNTGVLIQSHADMNYTNVSFVSTNRSLNFASDGSIFMQGGTLQSPTHVSMFSNNTIGLNGTTFNAQQVMMNAITLTFVNVNFPTGATINLYSQTGIPTGIGTNFNLNLTPIAGNINFVSGNKQGGVLLPQATSSSIAGLNALGFTFNQR